MHIDETTPVHSEREFESSDPLAKRAPAISMILPAWNEAEVIADAVAESVAALSDLAGDFEVIVVDDGSTDETAAVVRGLSASDERIRLIQHSPNQGYGAAIRSGFAAAQKDLVVFTDSDCQFDLTELDRFVLLSDRYDVVCGYRIDRKDTPLRCLYSKIYNLLVRALLGTGVRDVDCALKLFRRDVTKRVNITGNGFLVNSEILTQAKQLGCSIVEVGVSHRPRTLGESTVSVRHIPPVLASLARYWWNEVQFPAATKPAGEQEPSEKITHVRAAPGTHRSAVMGSYRLMQWALLLVAAIFLLTNLGYPLIDRDETRYAEIPREMLASGDWIVPQLNFQTYYDKPPMLYWLCAVSYTVLGVSETSARIVPALAALATLASTMFFGSRIFDRRIGLISGVVLMLSVGFMFTSRYLLLDGVLTLFVCLSLFTAYEALRCQRLHLGWWTLSGICIGLAFLTKGPVSFVLWLPPVFAFAWISQGHARPRWWHYGLIAAVATAIAAPWFIAVHQRDPTFLVEFFYRHNVARFAGEFHSRPIWYFVPVLLIAGHPWSFLTIPYVGYLFGRDEQARRSRPPAVGFLLLCSAWCFVFFSLSKCKLPTYLLPAAPALAIMIGHYMNAIFCDRADPARNFFARFWSARIATATTCLASVGLILFVILSADELSIGIYGWALLWTSLLVCSLLFIDDRHQARNAWGTSAGFAFVFALMVMHQMLPAYSRSHTLLGESSPLTEQIALEPATQIATVNHEFSEVPFYLSRYDIRNFANVGDDRLAQFVSQSGQCLLIIDQQLNAKEVRAQLPSQASMVEVARRGTAKVYEVVMRRELSPIASRKTEFSRDVQR